MKSFFIKINEQYVSKFEDSQIELESGTGGFYKEKIISTIEAPVLTDDFNKVMIIEGNINLKSFVDRVLKWEKATKKIINFEIVTREWNI